MVSKVLLVLVCVIVLFTVSGGCDTIVVDLSKYAPGTNQSVYKSFENVSDTLTQINVKYINENIGFFIIQIHAHVENVTLSYDNSGKSRSAITGTNIGLIYGSDDTKTTFYLSRNAKIDATVRILLVVAVYDQEDPVPGGCNLTFDTIVAPYQVTSYDDNVIAVSSQPPSGYGVSCDDVNNKIKVDNYHLFLKEYDNNATSYFDGILSMLTVDDIQKNGFRSSDATGYFKYRRLYSNYRGTGEIFAIVATYKNRNVAYIPAVSYGCDITKWGEDCIGPVSYQWKIVCALTLIFGLFTCFVGHKFFKSTLFIMGYTFGVVVTYILLTFEYQLSFEGKTTASLLVGIIYGAAWVFFWWKFGIPLLSVHITFLLAGFLLSSLIFYTGLADIYAFRFDLNYWLTFFCFLLVALIFWISFTLASHIFACSFLGAFACVFVLNYYIGGNLQYIVINTFRRITVKNFSMAEVAAPFQTMDIVQTGLWAALAAIGFYIQWRDQRGRPPFPPRSFTVVTGDAPDERTPLLIQPEVPSAPQFVY